MSLFDVVEGRELARAEHLPFCLASYDLCRHFEEVAHRFSRYHTYTLGTNLRDAATRARSSANSRHLQRTEARRRLRARWHLTPRTRSLD
ncbi:MAG: hypothetical protein ACLPX1_19805 [Steroidobacteraceae bacterium]